MEGGRAEGEEFGGVEATWEERKKEERSALSRRSTVFENASGSNSPIIPQPLRINPHHIQRLPRPSPSTANRPNVPLRERVLPPHVQQQQPHPHVDISPQHRREDCIRQREVDLHLGSRSRTTTATSVRGDGVAGALGGEKGVGRRVGRETVGVVEGSEVGSGS